MTPERFIAKDFEAKAEPGPHATWLRLSFVIQDGRSDIVTTLDTDENTATALRALADDLDQLNGVHPVADQEKENMRKLLKAFLMLLDEKRFQEKYVDTLDNPWRYAGMTYLRQDVAKAVGE